MSAEGTYEESVALRVVDLGLKFMLLLQMEPLQQKLIQACARYAPEWKI